MQEDSGEGQTCNLTTKFSRLASRRFKKRQRRKEGADRGAYTPQHGLGRNVNKAQEPWL